VAATSPLKHLANLLGRRSTHAEIPTLHLVRLRSLAEFDQYYVDFGSEVHNAFLSECELYSGFEPFKVEGICYVCGASVSFDADFSLTRVMNDRTVPVWRENVVCPTCGLRNRQRAAVQLVESEGKLIKTDSLYITEQASLLYKAMRQRHRNIVGSEFLGAAVPFGKTDVKGTRNEDLTHLTFPSAKFDAIMCFEVLEHIPDYMAALRELSRVLKPGGRLVMTVPFNAHIHDHSIRARVLEDGTLEHLLEPEYHIDPLDPAGCLCYRHFGWAMLDDLRGCGFVDPYVARYHSRELAYLGPDPFMFIATKG
jgi:SAM-dependent methyltransferase